MKFSCRKNLHRRVAEAVLRPEPKSPLTYGFRGALLGAVGLAGLLPLALGVVMGTVGPADVIVYAASGALFGIITGGSIGAVVGGEGR